MGGSGGFPVDLVLFGLIAAFLVLRLRSILGRRTGYERPAEMPPRDPFRPAPPPAGPANPAGKVIDGQVAAFPPPPAAAPIPVPAAIPQAATLHAGMTPSRSRALPDPASPLGQTLARMQAIDSGFTPAGFLDGAERAFRMIVTAFAAGDRVRLHGLLTEDTYRVFEQAIAAREAANQTQQAEIRAIEGATIEQAELLGNLASITVRIVSDQVSITRDAAGTPQAGTDAVTEITDVWTFERDLSAADPVWRLVAARSA
ncbi:MAG: Tim44 domain-containing protein [Rhodospirillales bacterium]|nr:Tim44 domain-containing protein [Rhodospirillales bacterium]